MCSDCIRQRVGFDEIAEFSAGFLGYPQHSSMDPRPHPLRPEVVGRDVVDSDIPAQLRVLSSAGTHRVGLDAYLVHIFGRVGR